jgi:hypothetical protein
MPQIAVMNPKFTALSSGSRWRYSGSKSGRYRSKNGAFA